MLRSLCKAGLPDGNVYEYAALKVLKFEKKFNAEKRKKELLEKYQQNQILEKERKIFGFNFVGEKAEKKAAKSQVLDSKKLAAQAKGKSTTDTKKSIAEPKKK